MWFPVVGYAFFFFLTHLLFFITCLCVLKFQNTAVIFLSVSVQTELELLYLNFQHAVLCNSPF